MTTLLSMIDKTNELHRNGAVRLSSMLCRKKPLSHLLILILLVLSPVTFSNNNIPNFTCESTNSVSVLTRAEATMAFVRTVEPIPYQPAPLIISVHPQLHVEYPQQSPISDLFLTNSHGRAPPA